jgi:hypothetical protein
MKGLGLIDISEETALLITPSAGQVVTNAVVIAFANARARQGFWSIMPTAVSKAITSA